MFKRLFDIFIASILGILCLPLALVLALVVRLESSGPAIHPSLRVGKDGKLFHYLRLRTMAGDSPRKTAVGKIIGNLSLDELPVFWNILKGDLSFVGPDFFVVAQNGAFERQALIALNSPETLKHLGALGSSFRGILSLNQPCKMKVHSSKSSSSLRSV